MKNIKKYKKSNKICKNQSKQSTKKQQFNKTQTSSLTIQKYSKTISKNRTSSKTKKWTNNSTLKLKT